MTQQKRNLLQQLEYDSDQFAACKPEDIQQGDIIYYFQMQKLDHRKPGKYRPFLVDQVIDLDPPRLTLTPITHSGKVKSLYSKYNARMPPDMEKQLQMCTQDDRPSYLSACQTFQIDANRFKPVAHLQMVLDSTCYKHDDFLKALDRSNKCLDKIESDYLKNKLPKRILQYMHQGPLYDLTVKEKVPDNNYPVNNQFIKDYYPQYADKLMVPDKSDPTDDLI